MLLCLQDCCGGCPLQFSILGTALGCASPFAFGIAFNQEWLRRLVELPFTLLFETVKLLLKALNWLWSNVCDPLLKVLSEVVSFLVRALWRAAIGGFCFAMAWGFGVFAVQHARSSGIPAACVPFLEATFLP